jgi:hypothetical protein
MQGLRRPLTEPDAATLEAALHRTARYGLDAGLEYQYDALK